jgi:hypothetical protein
VIHEQVIEHELPNLVDVLLAQAESREDDLAELGPNERVALGRTGRPRPSLADVMKERREKEGTRARDLCGETGREWELVRELASSKLSETIDSGHGVNIDSVHVIDVVMHPSDDG